MFGSASFLSENWPLERNETTQPMETAKITKAPRDKILDCGMRDTLSFDEYAHAYGKLK